MFFPYYNFLHPEAPNHHLTDQIVCIHKHSHSLTLRKHHTSSCIYIDLHQTTMLPDTRKHDHQLFIVCFPPTSSIHIPFSNKNRLFDEPTATPFGGVGGVYAKQRVIRQRCDHGRRRRSTALCTKIKNNRVAWSFIYHTVRIEYVCVWECAFMRSLKGGHTKQRLQWTDNVSGEPFDLWYAEDSRWATANMWMRYCITLHWSRRRLTLDEEVTGVLVSMIF